MRTLSVLCGLVLVACPAFAEDAAPRTVLERLIPVVRDDAALADDLRDAALGKLKATLNDDTQVATALSAALALISTDYAAGLRALADEDFPAARAKFQSLVESPNPFLSADARFLVARAYIAEERHEDALAQLVDLLDKHGDDTVRQAEAWFLRGQAAAAVLNRSQARRALKRFLRNYPAAPERERNRAEALLADLDEAEFDLLTDIHAKMDYSRRQLHLTETGRQTQEVQDDVVALLTELIDELEKKCGNCKGCKSCNGSKPGGSGQGGAAPGNSSGTSQAARITERTGP
ncbi:MAG TPA: tetratricopeptide repeat protein, partial [Planctomycetaceae bacterium]|nr:tetratricopeptide repeat protein [Planctomycetaceae bacterium]